MGMGGVNPGMDDPPLHLNIEPNPMANKVNTILISQPKPTTAKSPCPTWLSVRS